jgi:hypothetical protein
MTDTFDFDVYGNNHGFSLMINTPSGTHMIAAYGRLRVQVIEKTISIAQDRNSNFLIAISRCEDRKRLRVFIQTKGVSQSGFDYPPVTEEKWQEIIKAARKAEHESGQQEEDQEYESE